MGQDINSYALNLELNFQDRATESLRKTLNLFGNIESKASSVNANMSQLGSMGEKAAGRIKAGFDKAVTSLGSLFGDQASQAAAAAKSFAQLEKKANELEKLNEKGNKWDILRKRYQDQYEKSYLKFAKKVKEDYKGEKLTKKQLSKFDVDEMKHYKAAQAAMALKQQAIHAEAEGSEKTLQTKADLALIGQTITGAFKQAFGGIAKAASAAGLFDTVILKSAETAEKFHTINYRNIGTMKQLNDEMLDLAESGENTQEEWTNATIALRNSGLVAQKSKGCAGLPLIILVILALILKATTKFGVVLNRTTKDQNFAAKQLNVMTHYQKEFAFTGEDMNEILEQSSKDAMFMGSTGAQGITDYNNALLRGAAAAKGLGRPIHEATDLVKAMQDPFSTVAVLGPESLNWDFKKRTQELGKWAKDAEQKLQDVANSPYDTMVAIKTMQEQLAAGGISVDYADLPNKLKMMQGQLDDNPLKTKLETSDKDTNAVMAKNLEDAAGDKRKRDVIESEILAGLQKKLAVVRSAFSDFLHSFSKNSVAKEIAVWGVALAGVGNIAMAAFRLIKGGIGEIISNLGSLASWSIRSFGTMMGWMGDAGTAIAGWAAKTMPTFTSWAGAVGNVFNAAKGTVASWASSAATAISGWAGQAGTYLTQVLGSTVTLEAALVSMGYAAAAAGAAYAGWKVGSWIEKNAGLSDSVDKVARGQGTWIDFIKTAVTPAGMLSVGLSKLMQAYDKLADSEGRAAAVTRAHLKDRIVEQKLALQTSFAEATKKNDRATMDSIAAQLDNIRDAEQKAYAESAAGKTVIEQNRLDAQQDMHEAAANQAAKTSVAMTKDASGQQVGIAKDTQKTISDLSAAGVEQQAKVMQDAANATATTLKDGQESQLRDLQDQKAKMLADIDKSQKQAQEANQAALESTLDEGLSVLNHEAYAAKQAHNAATKAIQPSAETTTKKVVAQSPGQEPAYLKQERAADKANDDMRNEMSAAFGAASQKFSDQMVIPDGGVNHGLTKLLKPQTDMMPKIDEVLGGIHKNVEDLTSTRQEVAATQQLERPTVAADSIVTVKMDNTTARERSDSEGEKHKSTLGILERQVEVLHQILAILGTKDVKEIKDLLKQFLPELVRETDSGLASSANQWMY